MAIQIFLDDVNITADLNKQYALPASVTDGVYPDRSRAKWWDLLPAINAHNELRTNFFNDDVGVHTLTVTDTNGHHMSVRVLLRMRYTSRNR